MYILDAEAAAVVKGMLARGDGLTYISSKCGVPEPEVLAIAAGTCHTWVAAAPDFALPEPERHSDDH